MFDGMSGRVFTKNAAGGPSRRLVVSSTLGAVVAGSLLGLALGVLSPPKPPTPKAANASGTSTPSASVTGRPAAAPSRSPSPSASGKIRTTTRSEAAPPNAHVDRPWTDRTMQLMILEDVWNEGEGLVVRGAPGKLLSGAKAKAFYEGKGEEPKEFAVQATGEVFELRVRGDATFFGERYIGYSDHQELRQMGKDEFRERGRNAIDQGQRPPIWLKRSLGIEGPVIYAAEQYLG